MAADDDRFQRMHTDPRFQKPPRSKLKLPVDARFKRMLTDDAFVDPFSIDKRGRPNKRTKKKQHTLQRYYKFEGDDDAAPAAAAAVETAAQDAEENEDSEEDEESKQSSSSSSSESSSESEAENDEEEEEEESKVATTQTETRRLAVVNMDWSCIKAVDLLMVFNSFVPKGGSVGSVTIYPSQFGLEQMKIEELQGPSIFRSESKDDDDTDDDGEGIDTEKLRKYEKSKLRYYFAVITCDSVSTASALYTSCDGMEFERTSNILDIQFIPDDMQFTAEPRDVATEVVEGYEAPEYQTRALQLSNVKLTWDDDEPVRVKQLRRRFNADQLNDMDFKDYLASEDERERDDDEEEEDDGDDNAVDETKKNKYRSLLLNGADETDRKETDVDMEITFPSGLEELSKKYLDGKPKDDESVWEARLRKQREKKKEKKKDENEGSDKDDGNGFDDPFFNSDNEHELVDSETEGVPAQEKAPKVKKGDAAERRKDRELKRKEDGRNKAELELLLLNEQGDKVKKDKGKEAEDLSDPRFSALFNSHHFAIDPTDPRYKRSAAKLRVIAEMQQKRFTGKVDVPAGDADLNDKKQKKLELSSMVKSLKRKGATKRKAGIAL